jgi:hypothetical protein
MHDGVTKMNDDIKQDGLRVLTTDEVEQVAGGDQYELWWQQIAAARATALATQIGRGQVN